MAVQKSVIKQALIDMQNQLKVMTDTDTAQDKAAELLAAIIYDAITSGEVTEATFTVATTGTAAAQSGTATQNTKGKIS